MQRVGSANGSRIPVPAKDMSTFSFHANDMSTFPFPAYSFVSRELTIKSRHYVIYTIIVPIILDSI